MVYWMTIMMNELMNAMMRGRVRVGDDWSIEDEDFFLWSEIDLNKRANVD